MSEGEAVRSAPPVGSMRETAANLLLARALQSVDGACGMVVYRDLEDRWLTDRFALPGRPDRLEEVAPVMEAMLEWALHTERPVMVVDLLQSPWSRHLLHGLPPPPGSLAATPIAQLGTIWGAVAVYRSEPAGESKELLHLLADVATESLSALGAGRPEGFVGA